MSRTVLREAGGEVPLVYSPGMALNPGMLDSVIQTGVAFVFASAKDADGGAQVPFAVKQTRVYGPLTDTVYAHLVKTSQGVDYTISDEQGQILVVLSGFVSRELDLNPRQDELVYYRPQWREEKRHEEEHKEKAAPQAAEVGAKDDREITLIPPQKNYPDLVKEVFRTAKKLIQSKTDQHTIEVHLPADQPAWRGIIAALKTIKSKYSKIHYRLKIGDQYQQLNYQPVAMEGAPEYPWPDDKTILITGGLGGLGLLFAHHISQATTGCTLILVGRSDLDPDKQKAIEDLETLGAKIIYAPCDITDAQAVAALVDKYPAISGVIHGSGIIKDNFIGNKTLVEIDQVLAPKVKGLNNLDQATTALKLDYFMVLSSMAGAMGNPGQFDYAAANGYMDAYIPITIESTGNHVEYSLKSRL